MVSLLYSVRVVSGELTPEVDGSSDLAAWIELADLPALPRVQAVDAGLELLRRIPPS
jgi:8-oxo-dGTP diphosphatase